MINFFRFSEKEIESGCCIIVIIFYAFAPKVVLHYLSGKDIFSDHIPFHLYNPCKREVIVDLAENYFHPTNRIALSPDKG